jgi:CMP-N,N'-diacetyllegionaminic acid synthase
MNVLGVIPARGGSKGIKHKNMALLCARPLIDYTISAARASQSLSHFIVSTDCPLISSYCSDLSVEVVHRPPLLSLDTTPSIDVIRHTVAHLAHKIEPDIIILLQPTSPFRTSFHIDEAVKLFRECELADSLVSCVPVPHNFSPESLMVSVPDTPFISHLHSTQSPLRRQDKAFYLARNGAALYITTPHLLNHSILGRHIYPYLMDRFSSIDIDTIDDLKTAEAYLSAGLVDPSCRSSFR